MPESASRLRVPFPPPKARARTTETGYFLSISSLLGSSMCNNLVTLFSSLTNSFRLNFKVIKASKARPADSCTVAGLAVSIILTSMQMHGAMHRLVSSLTPGASSATISAAICCSKMLPPRHMRSVSCAKKSGDEQRVLAAAGTTASAWIARKTVSWRSRPEAVCSACSSGSNAPAWTIWYCVSWSPKDARDHMQRAEPFCASIVPLASRSTRIGSPPSSTSAERTSSMEATFLSAATARACTTGDPEPGRHALIKMGTPPYAATAHALPTSAVMASMAATARSRVAGAEPESSTRRSGPRPPSSNTTFREATQAVARWATAAAARSRSAEWDDASSRRSSAATSPSVATMCADSAAMSLASKSSSEASALSLRSSPPIWSLAKASRMKRDLSARDAAGAGTCSTMALGDEADGST
uniref:Uncharacterized protein n=1 Tax=Oryza glumipatula TaxID=40148 RepID=A0A0E0AZX0_9ORYZ